MELKGERVVLRPLGEEHTPALETIRAEPDVLTRWGPFKQEELTDLIGTETAFVIEVDGRIAGLIQYDEETDPMYKQAGIDLYLTTPLHGKGLGPEALHVLCNYLFEQRGHHRLSIDPAADNARAIRAYSRVGFKPVGVMRAYEMGIDGTFHDNLLMDLLAGELIDPRQEV